MSGADRNPILEAAMGLMDAAVPGIFEDPESAWRAHVSRLRFVVISRVDGLSPAQLKTVQGFSRSFFECEAENLVEIRAALKSGDLRLEPVSKDIAEANVEILRSEGISSHLAELSEEDRLRELQLLELLPPAGDT